MRRRPERKAHDCCTANYHEGAAPSPASDESLVAQEFTLEYEPFSLQEETCRSRWTHQRLPSASAQSPLALDRAHHRPGRCAACRGRTFVVAPRLCGVTEPQRHGLDCDIPLPPNTTFREFLPTPGAVGVSTKTYDFHTPDTTEQAIKDFYAQRLPSNGWKCVNHEIQLSSRRLREHALWGSRPWRQEARRRAWNWRSA